MPFEAVFRGEFKSSADVCGQFDILASDLADAELIFAAYNLGNYEGDATVYFWRAGQLFEVHGSHCSCYGLEGQWEPTATTLLAIEMRQGVDDVVRAIKAFAAWKGIAQ